MTIAPTLADAPSADDVAALRCPVDRARLLTRIARQCGTLPPLLADLRTAALIEARVEHGVVRLAKKVGLSAARISQITSPKKGPKA
jgi:hypothetical protein